MGSLSPELYRDYLKTRRFFTIAFTSGLPVVVHIRNTVGYTRKSANLAALREATTQFKFKNLLYEPNKDRATLFDAIVSKRP